jgi:hypothetical protein
MSLTTNIDLKLSATHLSALDLATAEAPIHLHPIIALVSGVAANQADVAFSDTRQVLTAATDSLDLAGGGLVDAFGVAFAPAKVRAILIYSRPTNTTNLTLFGDANSVGILNTAATTTTLTPGSAFLAINMALAGWAVGAGATDIVKIVNAAGATATYDIVIIGTSA